MVLGGFGWFFEVLCCFMVDLDGSWRSLVVLGDSWRLVMDLGGSWWFLIIVCGSWLCLVVLGGSCWFLVVI